MWKCPDFGLDWEEDCPDDRTYDLTFRYEVMNREENCLHWSLEDDGVSYIPLAILANDFNSRKRVYNLIVNSALNIKYEFKS